RENILSHELETERRHIEKYRYRNDELKYRLEKFDVWLQQLQQNPAANEQQTQLVMQQMQQLQDHLGKMHQYQNWITASAAALAPPPAALAPPVKRTV
ncbi:hypothetical protein PMAYCL1PPCAC_25503, partial [Pristionchus mayeri]